MSNSQAPASPVVELVEASKSFQRGSESVHALDRLSLRVNAGEMLALVGPSGCGKSTTLNLVSGVDFADSGEVTVCGVAMNRADESTLRDLRRQKVGVVFQAFHLIPHLSVEENIALPLALAGRRDPDWVAQLIETVGLGHRRQHSPAELSGGEQQRTAVARALVHRPRVVVADEPTGNLDRENGSAVLELLQQLQRAHSVALLLATHDLDAAGRADRVIELRDGAIVRDSG